MRDVKAQYPNTLSARAACGKRPSRMSDMRRPGTVSPQCGFWNYCSCSGFCKEPADRATHDGQRWALLTTKSRKTCTRATVFNSSG
jgi:hypothetical protein